jgi:hypothetical protein
VEDPMNTLGSGEVRAIVIPFPSALAKRKWANCTPEPPTAVWRLNPGPPRRGCIRARVYSCRKKPARSAFPGSVASRATPWHVDATEPHDFFPPPNSPRYLRTATSSESPCLPIAKSGP